MLNIGQALIIAVGVTGIMYMAARGILRGEATVGDFVLVNTYLLQLYAPLNMLGWVYREIKQSLVDMEKMFAVLRESVEVADAPGAPALQVSEGCVRFEGVCFGYEDRRRILRDVSFAVPAGKTIAIVGPTGSGKSTISRILFRFYDIQAGRVTIDDQDIREVTQASLRNAIGVVPQDTVLFNDTIRYNVAYGRPDATREEVEEAARMAQLHDFVAALPDGYETKVGERGLKLSGGEKAARGHCPHNSEGLENSVVRRGDLGAGHAHGEGHPAQPCVRLPGSDNARDRAPAVDRYRRGRKFWCWKAVKSMSGVLTRS